MADFYFATRIRVDINRYPSAEALLNRWLEEAEAAEQAEQAGVIQTLWKDANEPSVFGVLRVEADDALQAHAAILGLFKGLPVGQDNALIVEHVAQVRPYAEWREFLRKRKQTS